MLEALSTIKGSERLLSGRNIYDQILEKNILGPIVFVTPEIGRFSKIGGIAVMVDELTQALVTLGCEVIVVSPYYNFNSKGKTGYLKDEGVEWLQNIPHSLEMNVLKWEFIISKRMALNIASFITLISSLLLYHAGSTIHQLKTIVLIAKSSLELLCQLQILPAVIVSNDWYSNT